MIISRFHSKEGNAVRGWIQRFMYGRYGYDQLNRFLVIAYLVCYFLTLLTRVGLFSSIGMVGALLALFRMFSRNIPKRREENNKFLHATAPITRWWKLNRAKAQDKDHRYFKCPNCGQQLRVPKGKGKLNITCRNCGNSFEKNT